MIPVLSTPAFRTLGLGALTLALSTNVAQAAPNCSIDQLKEWKSGFVVREIVIRNDSSRTLSPPKVKLTFDREVGVDNSWGASAKSSGKTVTLTGKEYNARLEPGGSALFSFKGFGNLAGVACSMVGEGGTPAPDAPAPEVQVNAMEVSSPPVSAVVKESSPASAPSVSRAKHGGRVIWRDTGIDEGSAGQKWRGLKDTRIVGDCGGGHGQCLEVSYAPTRRGSDRLIKPVELPSGTDYTLLYDIRFGNDFEFVRGGKLPGLVPDVMTTGCRPTSPESWSARPMWRVEGAAQGYFYGQDRTDRCGEGETGGVGAFKPGRWQSVSLRVKLNDSDSSYDGEVSLAVDGKVVSRNRYLRLRSRITDASEISRFQFSTFYGGADPSWAPSKTTTVRYDNFRVVDNE